MLSIIHEFSQKSTTFWGFFSFFRCFSATKSITYKNTGFLGLFFAVLYGYYTAILAKSQPEFCCIFTTILAPLL
jgi:hypothetical protein